MSKAALTARYRPQTFAQLAGQDTLKAILSRAAAEDRIAPAYLFSGTRGVGKTTIARIFAKALNCRKAPTAEPCNECDRCRAITQGSAVDVLEIDGASNRGIDDVRRLKESVGYAPLEGRYKVFIIDEAHMLSREAFNALLKTLEEPPAHVTFILATTEPHKFPVTIISRCQHYVFKRLTQAELENHLRSVLEREQVAFEEAALRLLARRAAGSVRDGMSLLGQVLALGGEKLLEADVRSVLGLAGQELFTRLLVQVRNGSTPGLSLLVREILDQGLDLGFFLRELAATWRNLFMLRQLGDEALPLLDLGEEEAKTLQAEANQFELAHIHAAWQMVLEGQRRVLSSLEPALALELLLLNLALLPRLISLEQFAAQKKSPELRAAQAPSTPPVQPPAQPPVQPSGQPSDQFAPPAPLASTAEITAPANAPAQAPGQAPGRASPAAAPTIALSEAGFAAGADIQPADEAPASATPKQLATPEAPARPAPAPKEWAAFVQAACGQSVTSAAISGRLSAVLRSVAGVWSEDAITLAPDSDFTATYLNDRAVLDELQALLQAWCPGAPGLKILPVPQRKTRQELREELEATDELKLLAETFDTRLIDWSLERQ